MGLIESFALGGTLKIIGFAALTICLGILMGAFGAHGLEGKVSPERIDTWNTAAVYHLFNALGLLFWGMLREQKPQAVPLGGVLLLGFGILVFSGSLYALVLLDKGILGAITPIGGLALSCAWAWLGIHQFRQLKSPISG
jgi:uncharacterized membrane protein YgdD (TMEM256/DUF423 family)